MASFLDAIGDLFRTSAQLATRQQVENTPASRVLRRLNPHGLIGVEHGYICMIEDHADPDGRLFRLEYQSTPDGCHAAAWCRYNPWGTVNDVHTTHCGLICIGPRAHGPKPSSSKYDLEFVVSRARFWCIATSVYHETGSFPNL